jgi:hypothetical protein
MRKPAEEKWFLFLKGSKICGKFLRKLKKVFSKSYEAILKKFIASFDKTNVIRAFMDL